MPCARGRGDFAVVVGVVVGVCLVVGSLGVGTADESSEGVETTAQSRARTRRYLDFEVNHMLLQPALGTTDHFYFRMDPSNVPAYDAFLDDLRIDLRPKAEALLREWEAPTKCWICKCLVNLVLDDVWELLGAHVNEPSPLEDAARRILDRVCLFFGPAPFSFVCKQMVFEHATAFLMGILTHESPATICGHCSLCMKKGALPGDPALPVPWCADKPEGLVFLEEGVEEEAGKLIRGRPRWASLGLEKKYAAAELQIFFEKIQFHLECPACKCVMNFVYDSLDQLKEMVEVTDEEKVTEMIQEVCTLVMPHPPFNITCEALQRFVARQAVAREIIARHHPKAICRELLFCASDGILPGLRSPLAVDMANELLDEEAPPPKEPKRKALPKQKRSKPPPARSEHVDAETAARVPGHAPHYTPATHKAAVRPLCPCETAESRKMASLVAKYTREAIAEATKKTRDEIQRRRQERALQKDTFRAATRDLSDRSKWETSWEGGWKGRWAAGGGELSGHVRMRDPDDTPHESDREPVPQWECDPTGPASTQRARCREINV